MTETGLSTCSCTHTHAHSQFGGPRVTFSNYTSSLLGAIERRRLDFRGVSSKGAFCLIAMLTGQSEHDRHIVSFPQSAGTSCLKSGSSTTCQGSHLPRGKKINWLMLVWKPIYARKRKKTDEKLIIKNAHGMSKVWLTKLKLCGRKLKLWNNTIQLQESYCTKMNDNKQMGTVKSKIGYISGSQHGFWDPHKRP